MAAETTDDTDRTRAFREAGHAVLAAQLGVAIERVSIVPAPVGRSHVKLSAHPDLGAAEELVVLLAGEEAQRRLDGGEPVALGTASTRSRCWRPSASMRSGGGGC